MGWGKIELLKNTLTWGIGIKWKMNFDTPYYDGVFVSVNKMYYYSEKNTQYIVLETPY